jgi:hypothetical protein
MTKTERAHLRNWAEVMAPAGSVQARQVLSLLRDFDLLLDSGLELVALIRKLKEGDRVPLPTVPPAELMRLADDGCPNATEVVDA